MDQKPRLIDEGGAKKIAIDSLGLGEKNEKRRGKKGFEKKRVSNDIGRLTVDVATHKLTRWRGRN